MMRGATLLWAALAAAVGTGLFLLKYEVQGEEQRLHALHKDIVDTREEIHVLKAEWSYLNDPLRLKEQAERHLGLHPLKPGQMAAIDQVPMAVPASADPTVPTPRPALQPAAPKANSPAAKPAPFVSAKAPQPPKAKPPAVVATAKTPTPITTAMPPAQTAAVMAPITATAASSRDNVLVITSPALLEPEVASVRRHP